MEKKVKESITEILQIIIYNIKIKELHEKNEVLY